MIEEDLRNHLLNNESISDHIDTRLYPGWIPKDAQMPSVAFLMISGNRHHDIDVAYPRYQFSVFSKRYSEAKRISDEIINSLQRFKGIMGSTEIIQIVFQNQYDQYESDTDLYHISLEFKVIYEV